MVVQLFELNRHHNTGPSIGLPTMTRFLLPTQMVKRFNDMSLPLSTTALGVANGDQMMGGYQMVMNASGTVQPLVPLAI